jgi:hypothetical protein
MHNPPDIISLAYKQAPMHGQFHLLNEKNCQIPGSVLYSIKRYHRNSQWNIEDTGMMVYHYRKNETTENYLELKFCITGNVYCKQKDTECDLCKFNQSPNCNERVESLDVLSFRFSPVHLSQFIKPRKTNDTLTEDILNFKHASSFTKILPLCSKTRMVLEGLLNHSFTDSLENIYINAQTQMLLLYSLDCMVGEKEIDVLNCRFLANEADRVKITKAREILIADIG